MMQKPCLFQSNTQIPIPFFLLYDTRNLHHIVLCLIWDLVASPLPIPILFHSWCNCQIWDSAAPCDVIQWWWLPYHCDCSQQGFGCWETGSNSGYSPSSLDWLDASMVWYMNAPSKTETSEPACMKWKMLSMKSNTSCPSSSQSTEIGEGNRGLGAKRFIHLTK